MSVKYKRMRTTTGPINKVAVQFQNGIGNFIMMTPAIQAVASLHNAHVDVVLDKTWTDSRRQSVVDFCYHWPLINSIIEFDETFNVNSYKALFYAFHGEESVSHKYFVNNAKIPSDHTNWRADRLHEVDYYMNMAYNMGYRGNVPPIHIATGRSNKFVHAVNDSEYFRIGICNGFFGGSRWQWERKGWPYFQELITLLRRYFNGKSKVFLIGKSEHEQQWAETICDSQDDNVVNFVGKLDLADTANLIKYMDLFISTDTGLMHIADGLNIPLIAIFGATLISKNGPYNKEHRIVRSSLPCVPCQLAPQFSICKEWRCMETLTPDIVMSEVRAYVFDLLQRGFLRNRKVGGEIKSCLVR